MTHTCHWYGCEKEVPPAMWGCLRHWAALPFYIRQAINRWYVPGQEVKKNPSKNYVIVARVAQAWVEVHTSKEVIAGKPITREDSDKLDVKLREILKELA